MSYKSSCHAAQMNVSGTATSANTRRRPRWRRGYIGTPSDNHISTPTTPAPASQHQHSRHHSRASFVTPRTWVPPPPATSSIHLSHAGYPCPSVHEDTPSMRQCPVVNSLTPVPSLVSCHYNIIIYYLNSNKASLWRCRNCVRLAAFSRASEEVELCACHKPSLMHQFQDRKSVV